ncbi:MAG: FISUMP domain-containing protein, partial [Bacteroidales bacterium]|nr:FISUMP domain-containing protein [Bacteroidales bacterium]
IAKALASTSGWETFDTECAAGNDQESNNSTGFTTIPTGYRSGAISGEGKQARFWSSTNLSTGAETVYGMMLNYNMAHVSVNSGYDKNMGLSVRCVKDN